VAPGGAGGKVRLKFLSSLVLVYDHWQEQQRWEMSTRLLVEEVMPRLANLTGA
jgi:hypothetical protein